MGEGQVAGREQQRERFEQERFADVHVPPLPRPVLTYGHLNCIVLDALLEK